MLPLRCVSATPKAPASWTHSTRFARRGRRAPRQANQACLNHLNGYVLSMKGHERIIIDPAVCHGRPVIRGTRMPVTLVVGSLAGGMSFEEVQREYDLSLEDIRAALRFVGELAEQESFHPLSA